MLSLLPMVRRKEHRTSSPVLALQLAGVDVELDLVGGEEVGVDQDVGRRSDVQGGGRLGAGREDVTGLLRQGQRRTVEGVVEAVASFASLGTKCSPLSAPRCPVPRAAMFVRTGTTRGPGPPSGGDGRSEALSRCVQTNIRPLGARRCADVRTRAHRWSRWHRLLRDAACQTRSTPPCSTQRTSAMGGTCVVRSRAGRCRYPPSVEYGRSGARARRSRR